MNLGARLFAFLDRTSRHLAVYEDNLDHQDPLYDLLNENLDLLDLLRSNPEYLQHLATHRNDFAFLPNEIINDVVVIAGEQRNPTTRLPDYRLLSWIAGSWGDFARKPILTARADEGSLKIVAKSYNSGKIEEKEIPWNEAENQLICHTVLVNGTFSNWKDPKHDRLYGSIELTNIPEHALEELRTCCFSRIFCDCDCEVYNRHVGMFITRQLRSKYLRELTICALPFDREELNALLIEFVSRPTFEKSSPQRNYKVEFPVFEAALKSWKSKKHFEVPYQEVCGCVSYGTAEKIAKLFCGESNPCRLLGRQPMLTITPQTRLFCI